MSYRETGHQDSSIAPFLAQAPRRYRAEPYRVPLAEHERYERELWSRSVNLIRKMALPLEEDGNPIAPLFTTPTIHQGLDGVSLQATFTPEGDLSEISLLLSSRFTGEERVFGVLGREPHALDGNGNRMPYSGLDWIDAYLERIEECED